MFYSTWKAEKKKSVPKSETLGIYFIKTKSLLICPYFYVTPAQNAVSIRVY